MSKKILLFSCTLLLTLIFVLLASTVLWAKDPVLLDFDDIALRVPKENRQLDILQRTLPVLQKARDDMVKAGKDIESLSNGLRDLNAAYSSIEKNFDMSVLDKKLIETLQGSIAYNQATLGSINFDSIDMQIAQVRIQIPMTQAALINGGQQLFVGYHQLQDNIRKIRDSRKLLEEKLQLAKVQQSTGAGTMLAVKEAELALAELDTSILQMENQGAVMLGQLKLIIGWPQEQVIKLGAMPKPNRDYLGKIVLTEDIKSAQANSYNLKIKEQEHKYSSSDEQKRLIKLNIDAAKEQIALSVSTQYHKIVDINSNLLLEEQRLAVAEEKITQNRMRHKLGQISALALQTEENSFKTRQDAVVSAMDALLWEIEVYKSIVAGLN